MKSILLKLSESDDDIAKALELQGNVTQYLKELIRRDIQGAKVTAPIASMPKDNRIDTLIENLDEVYSIVKRIERAMP